MSSILENLIETAKQLSTSGLVIGAEIGRAHV